MSDSLQPHGLQHTRLPSPLLSPGACSDSCPLRWWCHPTISASAAHLSCLQLFPASRFFPMSWLFTLGGQSIGILASVLPMNIQGWFPLGLTGLISLLSKGLLRVFSSITIQKHPLWFLQKNKSLSFQGSKPSVTGPCAHTHTKKIFFFNESCHETC